MNLLKKILFLALLPAISSFADMQVRPSIDEATANSAQWNDFKKTNFKVGNCAAFIVEPETPRKDKAWVLRPAWWGAFANADHELLKQGFYVAFVDMSYTGASEEAMKILDNMYDVCTKKYGLSKKATLEGLSRGGLSSLMWANRSPQKLACVYVDNPVCDVMTISPNFIEEIRREWGLENMQNFKGSPIHNYKKLAKSKVPVLFIAGLLDETVPNATNAKPYVEAFKKAKGSIKYVEKPDGKHHPHGLQNPVLIVDFIKSAYDKI